jgi:2-polyprenyl-3-methyl-5-hydroxy-6-metoxy-1,4-benzoquinol methylase
MNTYNKILNFAGEHKKFSKKISLLIDLENKSVLDVGAGSGLFAQYLGEFTQNITLLEPSKSMLSKASKNFKKIDSSLQDFNTKNKFDFVVCIDSLHHLTNGYKGREEVSKGIHKMISLAKDKVIIIDPNIKTFKGKWIQIQENFILRQNSTFFEEEDYNLTLRKYQYKIQKWKSFFVVIIDVKK